MDVGGWLRKLDLEQYEAAFRENNIDDTILRSLTREDLEELGVGSVGHRRKLLDAIAALWAEACEPSPPADAEANKAAKDTAERRQVTVMFSDLVGSTALSARLDPEDLREVISAYQRCVADIVRRFGGFVARYMGDGVLVYFGYPAADEDDAEHAVRAGLAIIDAVAAISAPERLQVRIGAATGLVIVGDLVGSGEAQERSIIGETPNLAARLQSTAEPNTVVIAEATRKLVGNLFELQDLGPMELKGIAGPVKPFSVLRAGSVESRFEAMHEGDLTALVGREEELQLLLQRWAKAKSGEGQVVLLSGEAGIGKSRLAAAVMEQLAGEPHARLRYFCSPQHTGSALYPVIGQLERAAGFAYGDTPQTKRDKLDALLAQTATSRQDTALVAELLSLANDGRYPALELAPEQRRQKTLEALDRQSETLARSRPVLMIVEDAHWGDPTSLEAFGRTVDRIANLPVLVIVTFRPEFEAAWVGKPHVTALALNRLGHREVDSMIDRVVGNKALPADIKKDIIERTDGIPLFVEEMTKAVLETGSEREAMQTAAAVPPSAHAVPASLHASLMARLDRLGPAKELAQIGAAIGREFSHALLAAVARRPEAELVSSLNRLVRAGLLFRNGAPPLATYLFKHALVQDAAYGTLLRQPRRVLHARIADILESQFADIAEAQPDLLARHYTEAGLIDRAAVLWGKAGSRSIERSALLEAIEQLTRALEQIATLPTTPALRHEEIKLQAALIGPLRDIKGLAARETTAAAERARLLIEQAEALGEPPEDPWLLFGTLITLLDSHIVNFNGDLARESAAHIMAFAEKMGGTEPLRLAQQLLGLVLLLSGNMAEGRVNLDHALSSPVEAQSMATPRGGRLRWPIPIVLIWRSLALWTLGYPEAALASAEQAVGEARRTGYASTLMHMLSIACIPHLMSRNYATAQALTVELIALAEEKGSGFWKTAGLFRRASLLAATGKNSDAVSIFSSAIPVWRSAGATVILPVWLSYLAKACGEVGQFDDAWRHIGEAMKVVEVTKEAWYEAEVYRIAGEIVLISPVRDFAKAETYFARALAVAKAQQAKSWELRTATSMARLWHDQGRRDEARELLAPIYGWFTEGFATPDLKEAKSLLDLLAP
ncbi:adenylate/guanylate cyclase domain-containing protein [Bradyrhizobium sp. OAE829]|uniref:adenylate/guanylate cyclase domain-containing protein n=1 Tax=Bradyrhizobium sp. OAE829 TaxID=2663807 RepID=UPI00178902DA